MAIEISNLNLPGSDLFAGEESFLTDLLEADSNRVYGGSGGNKNKKNSKNNNVGGVPLPAPSPAPFPNPFPNPMPPCGGNPYPRPTCPPAPTHPPVHGGCGS
jgi:hypothetical protein